MKIINLFKILSCCLISFIYISAYASPPEDIVKTPFGELSIEHGKGMFNDSIVIHGFPIPKAKGNFSIKETFEFNDASAVLLMIDSGGSACPVQFRFIMFDSDSYVVSPEFGTCSDYYKVIKPSPNYNYLSVIMPGFNEPDASFMRHMFTYVPGQILESSYKAVNAWNH